MVGRYSIVVPILNFHCSKGLDKLDEALLEDRSSGNTASAQRRRVKVLVFSLELHSHYS